MHMKRTRKINRHKNFQFDWCWSARRTGSVRLWILGARALMHIEFGARTSVQTAKTFHPSFRMCVCVPVRVMWFLWCIRAASALLTISATASRNANKAKCKCDAGHSIEFLFLLNIYLQITARKQRERKKKKEPKWKNGGVADDDWPLKSAIRLHWVYFKLILATHKQ